MSWHLRLATAEDIPALEALIPLSVHVLQAHCYSPAQRAAALGTIFGVDRRIIADGTYFVAESGREIIACGGWSRRRAAYGSDQIRTTGDDDALDPACDAARIRAFFVHPAWARRGLGRALLDACEAALLAAGFRRAEMVATLAGEPLYAAHGYRVSERLDLPMRDGLCLPGSRMVKQWPGAT